MIIKEIDKKRLNNKYIKSGFNAEKEMSFYLKRAFGDDNTLNIINDLRLELGDDHAQIDHLIIHAYGFIIIESKSVSTKVCVNQYGEWKRIFNNEESGMPSPIKQAKRQSEFLKKFLLSKDRKELFRDTIVNKYTPVKIDKFNYDVLVAISDRGIIERENIELSEICKADSITERVTDIISTHNKEFEKIFTLPIKNRLHKNTIDKISHLLVKSHCPFSIEKEDIETVKEKPSTIQDDNQTTNLPYKKSRQFDKDEIYLCKHCKSPNLEIRNGQFSFYFKCLFCKKNTSLKLLCTNPTEACNPKLEVRGLEFFRVCKACGEEKLFFTNPTKETKQTRPKKEIPKDKQEEVCHKCNSKNMQILYGRYGYYFNCLDCNANRKYVLTCQKPTCKPKLKKEKEKFYKICNDCNIKELYFENNKMTE